MGNNSFSVYSLKDCKVVFNNPKVGKCTVSDEGGGRIVISYAGDLSSHTTTATGYVVVNKLYSENGSITLELPQNSPADVYMRKLVKFLQNAATTQFALTKMTLNDQAAKRTITATGLTPQKWPDENYDQTSGTRNYVFLAATIANT